MSRAARRRTSSRPAGAIDHCPVCGSLSAETIEESGRVSVERCRQCDVAYVTPPPKLAALEDHYDEEYYAEWITSQAAARRRLWRQRLDLVLRRRAKGALLDVGCGDGSFLEVAQAAGFQCAGTELSKYAATRVRERLGVTVKIGSLRSGKWPSASFDLITMWHVLEHVTDPRSDLEEVRRLLRPGGHLFIAVPNRLSHVFNQVYRLFKGAVPPLYTPDDKELHLFHFTPESLRRLLESCGFRIISVGLDVPDADWRKRLVDQAARAWFALTGVNRSMALCIVAKKPPEGSRAA